MPFSCQMCEILSDFPFFTKVTAYKDLVYEKLWSDLLMIGKDDKKGYMFKTKVRIHHCIF